MDLLKKYEVKGTNRHTVWLYGANGRYAGIDLNKHVYNEKTNKPGMYYCFGVKDPEGYSHGEGAETIWYGTLQEARAVVESYLNGEIPLIPVKCFRDPECEVSPSGKKEALTCKDCFLRAEVV